MCIKNKHADYCFHFYLMFPNVKKKVKILTILTTVRMQPSQMRPCKAVLVHTAVSLLHLCCCILCVPKLDGLCAVENAIFTTTQQFLLFCKSISNKLLCFFSFKLRRHMELENLAAHFIQDCTNKYKPVSALQAARLVDISSRFNFLYILQVR